MNTFNLTIYIFVLYQCTLSYAAGNQPAHCMVVKNDIFDDCTDKQIPFSVLSKNKKLVKMRNGVCINEGICRTKFNVTYIRRQLYNLKLFNQFSRMLNGCCGDCVSYTIANKISQISQINTSIIQTSDYIFPILAYESVNQLYGLYYIPVLQVPSGFYFTLSVTKQEKMVKLIMGCLSMWPLLVICLLMACISGFIVWVMERNVNTGEFPKHFHAGMSEGFWWSFVSMTTVGYGDKSPRSCKGRIFAVLWILVGITVFSIFTGSLTNHIETIHSPETPSLLGKKVGGLEHNFHDATMVAQHGGFLQVIKYNNTILAIVELIKSLQRKEIDGFILSRPSYYFFSLLIKKKKYKEQAARIKNLEMDKTEKQYLAEKLTLGMLVKNVDNYEYFRKYFEDNWLQIQDCNAFNLNFKAKKFERKSSSSFEGLFYDFLYGILVILAIIGCFGLLEEAWRCYVTHKANKSGNEESGRLHEMKPI